MSSVDESSGIQLISDIEAIIESLTLDEKIAMMSGSGFYRIHKESKKWGAKPYPAGGANERLGIEGLKFSDGPRGVIVGQSTCFPCSMARGASFDRDLERRIGEAMAKEARAQGVNLLGNVCVNLLRHPAWGRAQETYGEDSFHLGEMGVALSEGTQHHNVIATVKHFALNSVENTRFELNVLVDERTLYEVYLPHFRKVIESGCLSVMSAYNKLNGEYCGQNKRLLTDILRREWGFQGIVHSDWVLGVYSPFGAVAGLDVENPEPAWFGAKLRHEIDTGSISENVVDQSVERILHVLKTIREKPDPQSTYEMECVAGPEHRLLAREAAEKSAVLLTNSGLLPITKNTQTRIGVFGRLADDENTGDNGSSRVTPPYVKTPLSGLTEHFGSDCVQYLGGEFDLNTAAVRASDVDLAIIVVGYTAEEEGEFIPKEVNLGQDKIPEYLSGILDNAGQDVPLKDIGGDRVSLSLPKDQINLIRAVSVANPNTVVVVVAGSAVMVEEWIDCVPAVLQVFYAGMEGGTALARILSGDVSPSGRLPFTVAKDESEYPFFDRNAKEIEYGYWHGYSKFDRDECIPRFPFGHGLTYSEFEYSDLRTVRFPDGALEVRFSAKNTGGRAAIDTPQLYIYWPGRAAERPVKSLRGFERVELAPGQVATIRMRVNASDLAWFDDKARTWKIECGEHQLMVATSSQDRNALVQKIYFEREIDLGL